MSVTEVAGATRVTATAVRQRLTRLMGLGLVERELAIADGGRAGRGVASPLFAHRKARRQAGNNFPDLAIVLWHEIRGVKDQEIRRGLLERIASALATLYRDRVHCRLARFRTARRLRREP